MITTEEKKEIILKGQSDGARLFRVAQTIYTALIVLNWIIAIGGVITSIVLFAAAADAGSYGRGAALALAFGALLGTVITCVINYAIAVLTTHSAKVLVHLLFSSLALLSEKTQ